MTNVLHGPALQFTSPKMARNLSTLGIVPRKTKVVHLYQGLLDPSNAEMLRHAVRGIFEGDGSLFYWRRRGSWRVSICGTQMLLKDIQRSVNQHAIGPSRSSAKGSLQQRPTTSELQYDGRLAIPAIYSWMYDQAHPACVLRRKAEFAERAVLDLPPIELHGNGAEESAA